MKRTIILLILSFSILQLSGQERDEKPLSSDLEQKVISSLKQNHHFNNIDSLLESNLMLEARDIYNVMDLQGLVGSQKLYLVIRFSKSYLKMNLNYESFCWLSKGNAMIDSLGLEKTKWAGDIYYYLAQYYNTEGLFNIALNYYQLADNCYKDVIHSNDNQVYFVNLEMASIYRWKKSDYENAEHRYKEALRIAIEKDSSGSINIIYPLYSLATTYRLKGEYDQGLNILNRFEKELENSSQPIRNEYGNYVNICYANLYRDKGLYDLALKYFNLSYKRNPNNGLLCNNIAYCYERMDKFEEARGMCKEALSNLDINVHDHIEEFATSYHILGLIDSRTQNLQSGISNYLKSLEYRKLLSGDLKTTKKISINHNIGDLYCEIGEYTKALHYLQSSIIQGAIGFSELNPLINPQNDRITNGSYVIGPLKSKAYVFRLLYQKTGEVKYLEASMDCIHLCDTLFMGSWQSLMFEESKLQLQSTVDSVYSLGVRNAFDMFIHYDDEGFIDDAQQFFERNRYQYLFERHRSLFISESLGVPDSILSNIQVQEFIRQGLNGALLNDPFNEQLRDSLSYIMDAQESQREILRTDYPEYYGFIHNLEPLSLEAVQDSVRNDSTILIQYFDTWDQLFSITTDGNSVLYHSFKKDSAFAKGINKYKQLISSFSSEREDYDDYVACANYLYYKLLEPCIQIDGANKIKNIVIVPDGELSDLSFDALLASHKTGGMVNYKDLVYLIQEYCISYAYSVNILYTDQLQEIDRIQPGILGFSYGENIDSHTYPSLKGSTDEMRHLKRTYLGKYYMGKKATKQSFQEHASGYEIIHLSLHSSSNPYRADSTFIVFRNPNNESGWEPLFTSELLNMDVNTKLTVLNSCETGTGMEYAGEGIYSMARAFSYSGCQSFISSYWSTNDESSALIINDMYSKIDIGMNTSKALRYAKLEYISNAPTQQNAHPYFWAAHIVNGKPVHVKLAKRTHVVIWGLALATILTVFFIFIIRYKQKR